MILIERNVQPFPKEATNGTSNRPTSRCHQSQYLIPAATTIMFTRPQYAIPALIRNSQYVLNLNVLSISILNIQYSFSILYYTTTTIMFTRPQYLKKQYSILNSQYSISILHIQYSISILDSTTIMFSRPQQAIPASILISQFSILNTIINTQYYQYLLPSFSLCLNICVNA